MHTSGGRGHGGALILDRCRAFDLFASVDAHLCLAVLTALVHVRRELRLREGDSLPCKPYNASANKTDLAHKKIHMEQLTKVILCPANHTVLLQTD